MPRSTLLLLESDDLNLARFSECFESSPFQLIQASSSKEVFEHIKTQAKSLAGVILDFELATNDVDILERLRKIEFDEPIPVILMGQVALAEDEIHQLLSDSGYNGYIYKSMAKSDILSSVAAVALRDQNQRSGPRILFQVRALCHFKDQTFVAETYTLSQQGMFIRSHQNMPAVGLSGQIVFNIGKDQSEKAEFPVEVLYQRVLDEKTVSIFPPGFGVRFLSVPTNAQNLIESLFRHHQGA